MISSRKRWWGLGLVLAFSPAFASAADWAFEPVVNLGIEHSNNVFSLGAPSSADDFDPADTSSYLSVAFAWTATTRRSSFSFNYTPFFERYQDFSTLDNTAHRVGLIWAQQQSPRVDWETRFHWARQQRQRVIFDNPAQDQIILPQNEFDTLAASLQGRFVLSERSRVVAVVSAGATSYSEKDLPPEDIDGDGTFDVPGVSLDDARDISLQLGWESDLSPRKVVGVSVFATRIDEDRRGEYDVYRLLGVYRWGQAEHVVTTLTLGGAQTSVRDPGWGVFSEDLDEPSYLVGTLGIEGTIRRRTRIRGGIFRDVQASGGVTGTALTSGAFISLGMPTGRWSTLNLFARSAKRKPVRESGRSRQTDTVSFRAEWAVALSSRWFVVFAGERFDQSSDLTSLEGDFNVLSAGVRWTPASPRR